MHFFSIDVETANEDYSSICQIGVAEFRNNKLVSTWESLIDPKCGFSEMNMSIHGITPELVRGKPSFSDIYDIISGKLSGNITVHHSPFDRISMNYAAELIGKNHFNTSWLDSARIARRTWIQFSRRGYGLKSVAYHLGIKFKHHDALNDAIAAGKIAIEAIKETGVSINEWMYAVDRPITMSAEETKRKLTPDPAGRLFGEAVVFTGSLVSMDRNTAYIAASEAGCEIKSSVSKKVSMLIVGIQDPNKLNGYKKSSKHRRALELIKAGSPIRIITEWDFIDMIEQ